MYNTDFLSAGFVCTTSCHDSYSNFIGSYSSYGAVGLSLDDRSYGAVGLSLDDREGIALIIIPVIPKLFGESTSIPGISESFHSTSALTSISCRIFMFLRFLLFFSSSNVHQFKRVEEIVIHSALHERCF